MFLLALYVLTALSISFLCSIMEATLLSCRITELAERKEEGDKGAAKLLDIKTKRVDDAISAILTFNTVAHTIGAAMAGAQAAIVFGSEYVGVFSGVLTLLVLVITEIIPKTIGTVYASALVGPVAWMIDLIAKILYPVVYLSRSLTRMISSHGKEVVSRGELVALIRMAAGDGAIDGQEKEALSNILKSKDIKVEDVMTPKTVMFMLPADSTLDEFMKQGAALSHSRIPLYSGTRDQVTGYVHQQELLREVAKDVDPATPLNKFEKPVWLVHENASLGRALHEAIQHREHLAVVIDEFGTVGGIVTLEDIVETILGVEIVDETDQVEDLRIKALDLRKKRLEKKEVAIAAS